MYTVEWAKNFDGFKPKEELDIHKFTQFYDKHIANRFFTYETTSSKLPYFVVRMEKNQLPHLFGLQHWNNIEVKQPKKQYEKILSGEWSLEYLKKADPGSYKEFKLRIAAMPYLYNMLYYHKCQIKLLNKNIPSPFQKRRVDMLFQKEKDKYVYLLELREIQESNNLFVPISLTVHRKNSNNLRVKSEPIIINNVLVEKQTID